MNLVITDDPEHRFEFYAAVHGCGMALALSDLLEELRRGIKYEDKHHYEEFRKMLVDHLADHGVNLDWILEA